MAKLYRCPKHGFEFNNYCDACLYELRETRRDLSVRERLDRAFNCDKTISRADLPDLDALVEFYSATHNLPNDLVKGN